MFKLAGLVVLFLGVAQADRGMQFSGDSLKKLAIDQPQFCIPYYLMMAQQCVNVPKLFNPRMFKECEHGEGRKLGNGYIGRQGGKLAQGVKRNFRRNRKVREAKWNDQGGFGFSRPKSPSDFNKMRQFAVEMTPKRGGCDGNCMAECVLNRTGHLDKNGNIVLANLLANYTNALNDLTAGSKAAWSPLIANIINTCMTNVSQSTEVLATTTTTTAASTAQTTAASVPAEPKKVCKSDSRRLMTCIQIALITQAPSSELKSATNAPSVDPTMPTCAERTAQLNGCDFNYMLTPDQLQQYFGGSRQNGPLRSQNRGRGQRLTGGTKQGSSEENGGQPGQPDMDDGK
ncbi:uncharacterized protein LOC132194427 [Neocloeon triangulifer]|uniref:uncharacterized protein LOC132194427 n=1 Tax=Neocloeon triangulifer TaxID=2078957 RepID=UPI00286F69F8|nr:uncharacterized protein LOC132194427 [Neocloeon triangulifer]